jgi:hypothetical protein
MRRLKFVFWGVAVLAIVSAVFCVMFMGREETYLQLAAANNSLVDIHDVLINAGGAKNELGFFSPTPPSRGPVSTAGGCRFVYSSNTTITWEEDGKTHEAVVDVMKYCPKRQEIRSFSFFYLGNDQWNIVAQSDTLWHSPVITP